MSNQFNSSIATTPSTGLTCNLSQIESSRFFLGGEFKHTYISPDLTPYPNVSFELQIVPYQNEILSGDIRVIANNSGGERGFIMLDWTSVTSFEQGNYIWNWRDSEFNSQFPFIWKFLVFEIRNLVGRVSDIIIIAKR